MISVGRKLLSESATRRAHRSFMDWDKKVAEILDSRHPNTGISGQWSSLPTSMFDLSYHFDDPIAWTYFKKAVQRRIRFLSNYQAEIHNARTTGKKKSIKPKSQTNNRVFVVHGRDEATRETVARFLEKLKLDAIILHEQPNRGRTIIEKFVDNSDVAYAIVLLTADDIGGLSQSESTDLRPRARQNVIFELGFFLGKLGCDKVCALCESGIELPSDYAGVVYIPIDDGGAWRLHVARELKTAGMAIDLNAAM